MYEHTAQIKFKDEKSIWSSSPLYESKLTLISIVWDLKKIVLIIGSPLYPSTSYTQIFVRKNWKKTGPVLVVPYKRLSLISEHLISEADCRMCLVDMGLSTDMAAIPHTQLYPSVGEYDLYNIS